MLTFIFRFLTPLLALTGAAALAVTAWLAVQAYGERQRLAVELSAERAAYTAEQQDIARLENFEVFAERTGEFVDAARSAGVHPEHWSRYEVNLEERSVTISELDRLLNDARSGPGYYFRPEEVLVTADPGLLEDAEFDEDGDAEGILTLIGHYRVRGQ